jgi:hypothetical protein
LAISCFRFFRVFVIAVAFHGRGILRDCRGRSADFGHRIYATLTSATLGVLSA